MLGADIPLMYFRTDQVIKLIKEGNDTKKNLAGKLLDFIKGELPDDYHIEHVLSHLVDMIALAERSKDVSYQVGVERITKIELQSVHHLILRYRMRSCCVVTFGHSTGCFESMRYKLGHNQ